jgi:hypothetical protein
VPAFAQEKDAVDPEVYQQIEAALNQYDEAYNKHDAAAIAALLTQDAVEVLGWEERGGGVSGQLVPRTRSALLRTFLRRHDTLVKDCSSQRRFCDRASSSHGQG